MKNYLKKIIKFIFAFIITYTLYTVLVLLLLKWVNPPITSFIEQKSQKSSLIFFDKFNYKQKWVSLNKISKQLVLAVITSEDQKFLVHSGFDYEQIDKALNEMESGKRLRGASTITQQTAKNLFLYPARNIFRKALEAYYTFLIEKFWSKRRIIEIYLNTAEWGKNIYGVQAASNKYFRKPAEDLNIQEASELAAVLPSPIKHSPIKNDSFLERRSKRIIVEMQMLGGVKYIKKLYGK